MDGRAFAREQLLPLEQRAEFLEDAPFQFMSFQ
jgi:hypothetical protein